MNNRDLFNKIHYLLFLVSVLFLLIFLRVWFLTTLKHEEYREKALKPQTRSIVEMASRGTIRDRFNIPLAINKLQYNVAVCYDRIQKIPFVSWVKGGNKEYKRSAYVEKLSQMLSEELDMDPVTIKDVIYSKASIFPNTPFVLKEDVSEQVYYRLRMKERSWVGLVTQKSTKRFYPQGRVGCDVIGYIGAIDQKQYRKIAREMDLLQKFLKEKEENPALPLPTEFFCLSEVKQRLSELKKKAYTIHAFVGKSGIERKFEESLRGNCGKKHIEIGAKGNFIRNLDRKEALSGNRLLLTLSSELQAYAEELLIQSEEERSNQFALEKKNICTPWIKGGAIVAVIPSTGEVVALASYPRFDLNDFILTGKDRQEKIFSIYKWLETPTYIGHIWDGICPLEREQIGYIEKRPLTWELYLNMVLSLQSTVREKMKEMTIKQAVHLQHVFIALLKISKCSSFSHLINALYPEKNYQSMEGLLEQPSVQELKEELDPFLLSIKHNDDKLLFLDLLRVVVNGDLFHQEHLIKTKEMTLDFYRHLNQHFSRVQIELKKQAKQLYHDHLFFLWRKNFFKDYLKKRREEEKKRGTYPHPYIDYLTKAENALFNDFWQRHKWKIFEAFLFGTFGEEEDLHPFLFHLVIQSTKLPRELQESVELLKKQDPQLLKTFRCYHELTAPLWGHYPSLRGGVLRDLASAYYPKQGFGYGKSYAYGKATSIGSLFKLVTGYEALKQTYLRHREEGVDALNPLTIIDEVNKKIVTKNGYVLGRHIDGTLITRHYKGGRLPRSYSNYLGKVDFRTAVECSSNIYFSLLAGDVIDHPEDLEKTTRDFGFGKVTGIDLYGEIRGNVPKDICFNRAGLYAFAIGQHSLVVTPLQTTMMLSAIGNGGFVLKPQIVKMKVDQRSVQEKGVEITKNLNMANSVRTELIEGMRRVIKGERGSAQPYRIRSLYEHPKWLLDYKAFQDSFIGKTSTAEFVYFPTLDREGQPIICNEIGFGALSFKEGESYRLDMPDLSVVVFLNFGDHGKEAAPLAVQIIKKWRGIQKKQ